jgi:galacturan 1,4-alpha-galacturonidase
MMSSKYLPSDRSVLTNSNMNKVLNLTLNNAQMDFFGFLKYSADIDYWINNTWHIPALQNQAIGLSLIGRDFVIDGHGTGGLDGNGQVWYEYAEDAGNIDGRWVCLDLSCCTDLMLDRWD